MLAVLPILLGVQFILQALALDVQNVPNRVVHQPMETDWRVN
jgi:hypothetical protein